MLILTSEFPLVCFEFRVSDDVRLSFKFFNKDCGFDSCGNCDCCCCEVVSPVDVDGNELTIIMLFNEFVSFVAAADGAVDVVEFNETFRIAFGET